MTIAQHSKQKIAGSTGEKMLTGKLEGKLKTAKSMLDKGVTVDSIAKFMDLSFEQVECVQTEYN